MPKSKSRRLRLRKLRRERGQNEAARQSKQEQIELNRAKLHALFKTEGGEKEVTMDDKKVMELMKPVDHKVLAIRDGVTEYPDLWLAIYIVGNAPGDEAAFARMFTQAACWRVNALDEADLVVFTGGEDISPYIYGQDKMHQTHTNSERDTRELVIYAECLEKGIPMLGVCRGAQFLHAMNGGQLYQDVSGHNGAHPMWAPNDRESLQVSSVHHQLCIRNKEMEILGVAFNQSQRRETPGMVENGSNPGGDVEAFFYPETACLGVQGHPEYAGYPLFTKWVLSQLNEYIILNVNIDWKDRVRRLKTPGPETLKMKELLTLDDEMPL